MSITSPAQSRHQLPQLADQVFLADGGIETTLIYHQGIDLPEFAAFVLLEDERGREELRRYFRPYAEIAADAGLGLVLETATWRASRDWGSALGYTPDTVAAANRAAVELVEEFRRAYATPDAPVVISGCIGPRGDGYAPESLMTADEAEVYHGHQIGTFAETAADLVTRDHDDPHRRGDRHRPCRCCARHPERHLVHRGDRRTPALGRGAR